MPDNNQEIPTQDSLTENWEALAGDFHGIHDALKPHVERLLGEHGVGIPPVVVEQSVTHGITEDMTRTLETSLQTEDNDPAHILDSFLKEPDSPVPGTGQFITGLLSRTIAPLRTFDTGDEARKRIATLSAEHENLVLALASSPVVLAATVDYALNEGDDWQKITVADTLTTINDRHHSQISEGMSTNEFRRLVRETPSAVSQLGLEEAHQALLLDIKPRTVHRILSWHSAGQDFDKQHITVQEAAILGKCMENDLMASVTPTADEVRKFNAEYARVGDKTRTALDQGLFDHRIVLAAESVIEKARDEDFEGNSYNKGINNVLGLLNKGENDLENVTGRVALLEAVSDHGCNPVDAARIINLSRTLSLELLGVLMDDTARAPEKQEQILNAIATMARLSVLFEGEKGAYANDRIFHFDTFLEQAEDFARQPTATSCEVIEKLAILESKFDALVVSGADMTSPELKEFIARKALHSSLSKDDYGAQLDGLIAFGQESELLISNGFYRELATSCIATVPDIDIPALKEAMFLLDSARSSLPGYFNDAVNTLIAQEADKGLTLDGIAGLVTTCNRLSDPERLVENLKTVIPIRDVYQTAWRGRHNLGGEDKLLDILGFVISEGEYASLIQVGAQRHFDGAYGDRIADLAIRAGDFTALNEIGLNYRSPPSAEQLHSIESLMLEKPNSEYCMYVKAVQDLPETDRPLAVQKLVEVFGEHYSVHGARQISSILYGKPSPAETDLVQTSGEAGLAELQTKISAFAEQLKQVDLSEVTLRQALEHPLLLDVMMRVTRYEQSAWGAHGGDAIRGLIEYHQSALADGRLSSMPGSYQPSQVLEIPLLKAQKERAEWTEDVVERYTALRFEMQTAVRELQQPAAFSKLFSELRDEVVAIVDGLETTISSGVTKDGEVLPPKALDNMIARKDTLRALTDLKDPDNPRSYELRSLKNFEQNFTSLARHTELHSKMRTLTFAWALRKNPGWTTALTLLNIPEDLTTADISATREFVDHVTNQETFKDYFSDKRSANLFKNMTSTKALEEALSRAQNVGVSNDTAKVQFVPTRGMFMELSGHIADACWASRYNSIAETMPNMTAVIMKRNPGDPLREKLIGAGMLLETTAQDGSKVLLIRGLNPLEDFINRTSVESFYEAFTTYARGVAEVEGRKLAIVIDDHAGGSATNRPALFNFLTGLKRSLSKIEVDASDTTFNGYNVSKATYIV
jgi:hypothetical protein